MAGLSRDLRTRTLGLWAPLLLVQLSASAAWGVDPVFPGLLFPSPDVVAIASADFDGDGIPDVAALTDASPLAVNVHLASADGTLAEPVAYPIGGPGGSAARAIAAGHLNGDTAVDLVATSVVGATLSILFGNGDGTFQPSVDSSLSPSAVPSGVAVADVNGDPHADIVTANAASADVSVVLSNGDGTFQAPVAYSVGSVVPNEGPVSVAVALLDGDAFPDLAVARVGSNPSSSPGDVRVLLGNGDGSFQAAVAYPAGILPRDVAAGHMNGDAFLDLVAGPNVLLGNGDGSFQAPIQAASGGEAVALGQLDADPHLDVVSARGFSTFVYQGNGDGSLSPGVAESALGLDVLTLDVDDDAVPDLATADNGWVSILLGNGDGTFEPSTGSNPAYPVGDEPENLVAADFDRDGAIDVATLNQGAASLSVALGNGDGTFAASLDSASTLVSSLGLAAADLDGDTFPDLVGSTWSDSVEVLIGIGDGTFASGISYATGASSRDVAVADLTRNGHIDVVSAGGGAIAVLLGNGDGTLQSRVSYPVGGANTVRLVDLNGDLFPDAVTANSNGTVSVLLANGDGSFQAAVSYPADGSIGPGSVSAADLDGDGAIDLVVPFRGFSGNGTVVVLRGNGDGTFQPQETHATGGSEDAVAVGRLDANGTVDIVVTTIYQEVRVLLGNGDGTFAPVTAYSTGRVPIDLAIADVDGSGGLDLIVANEVSEDFSVLLNLPEPGLASMLTWGVIVVALLGRTRASRLGSTRANLPPPRARRRPHEHPRFASSA